LKAAHDAGYDDGVQVRVRSQADYDHSYYFVRALSLTHPHHSQTRPSADFDLCGRPHSL
jgi:S-formylglutathione hydrolase FrmB